MVYYIIMIKIFTWIKKVGEENSVFRPNSEYSLINAFPKILRDEKV